MERQGEEHLVSPLLPERARKIHQNFKLWAVLARRPQSD